jgi:hypothetical protein
MSNTSNKCINKICAKGKICNPITGRCNDVKSYNKNLKKITGKTETKTLNLPRTKKTIKDFVKDIEKYDTAKDLIKDYNVKKGINNDKDMEDVLNVFNDLKKINEEENTKSIQGFIYERLWDICIKLGITELADKHTTTHGIGNINDKNKAKFKKITDFFDENENYINEGIISGNSGGYSDITFVKNIDNKKILYLVSVKYTNVTDIKKMDIQNLCTIIEDRANEKDEADIKLYDDIKILLFVKNKGAFKELCEKAKTSSNLLIKYISPGGNYENVYDLNDLELHYKILKKLLMQYDYLKNDICIRKFKRKYLEIEKNKAPFIPRFHQELFIEKINSLMKTEKKILVGAIPRSGKTYIMAGTILKHVQEHNKKGLKTYNNYIIITPAPNETLGQYKEAFDNHIDFDTFDIEAKVVYTKKDIKVAVNKHIVYLISKQRLENGKDEGDDEITEVKKNKKNIDKYIQNIKDYIGDEEKQNIKIIFMDEAHFGMSTDIAQKIVECLEEFNSVKIFVTATYNKPLKEYKVDYKNVIKWDLKDIRFIKNISKSTANNDVEKFLEYFDDKFGNKIVDLVLKRDTLKQQDIINITNQYQHFPEPFLITSVWDKDFLDKQRMLIEGTNFGFDMDKLFTYRKDGETFENEDQLIELFEYYLGYPIEKTTDIKSLKFKEYVKDKKETENKEDYPDIKEKLTKDISHIFKKPEITAMNIHNYSDIILKIGDKYYKSVWKWKKEERNYKEKEFFKTRGILPRIRDVCTNECRTLQHIQYKTSQLWFLPGGVEGRLLDYIIFSLLQFLQTKFTNFYDNHTFFICRTKEEICSSKKKEEKEKKNSLYNKFSKKDNIKFQIEGIVIKDQINSINKSNKKQGLIILSGGKLRLGVSLPSVDIVTLFSNSKSFDAIYQMMFRSMTEVDTKEPCNKISYCAQKKYGFMVDLNPQRVLITLDNLQSNNPKGNKGSSKYDYTLIADLINIDRDIFKNEYDTNKNKKKQREEIEKFSEEFLTRLRDCVINTSSHTENKDLDDLIDKIVDYDTSEFVDIIKDYLQLFKKNEGDKKVKHSKKDDNNAIPSGKKGVAKKKDSKGTEDSKGNEDSKGTEDSKSDTEMYEPTKIKQDINSIIKIVISILSIITPCFDDDNDECVILKKISDSQDDYGFKHIKDTIIELLDKIEINKIITKDLFLKIFKDRVDVYISDVKNDDELFEFIRNLFIKMKEKQVGGNKKRPIIRRKKGGNIINIDRIYQTRKMQIYNIKDPEKLLEQINKTIPYTETARKERGEVFTPMKLVNEMLDTLPAEVWLNKDLKWLDPSAGLGNFPIAVYMRLMIGLKSQILDEDKRRKHILEEMIYMVELDKGNVFMMNKIFCGKTYKLNIFQGSFIEGDYKGINIFSSNIKYDIILGNPPYNQGGIRSKGKEKGEDIDEDLEEDKPKTKTIWTDFIKKSFELLKDSGYLLFINPLSWLKKTHSLHNSILEKHIIYLELWDVNYSKSNIKAEIPLSIFLLHNIDNKKNKTIIKICNDRAKYFPKNIKIYLDKNLSIPLGHIDILLKLRKFVINNNCSLEYKTKKSADTTLKKLKKEKNQLIYKTLEEIRKIKAEDKYCIDTYVDDKDKEYQLNITKTYHPDYDKIKLILSHKASLEGIFIDKGKLGICGTHNYYILGNNLELIKKILTFEIIKKASMFTKYGQNLLDTDFFTYVPDLRKLGYTDITEDEFNKLIGL